MEPQDHGSHTPGFLDLVNLVLLTVSRFRAIELVITASSHGGTQKVYTYVRI